MKKDIDNMKYQVGLMRETLDKMVKMIHGMNEMVKVLTREVGILNIKVDELVTRHDEMSKEK